MSYDFKLDSADRFYSTDELTSNKHNMGSHKGGCCGGRSKLEKFLLFLVVLTVAAAAAACVAVAVVVSQQSETTAIPPTQSPDTTTTREPGIPEDDTICVTPGCVAAAARVNNYIDYNVHPCDNFFEYACGNWIRKHPIPEEKSSIDTFGVLRDDVEVTLKGLLEESSGSKELTAITMAKDMYRSCVNESQIETLGEEVLDALFAELGDWPILNETWDPLDFDLESMLVKIRLYDHSPLIRQYVGTDAGDSFARIISLDQPSLIMPGRDYYNETRSPTSIGALTEYLENLAIALGNSDPVQVKEDIQKVVDFEKEVAMVCNICPCRSNGRIYRRVLKGLLIHGNKNDSLLLKTLYKFSENFRMVNDTFLGGNTN